MAATSSRGGGGGGGQGDAGPSLAKHAVRSGPGFMPRAARAARRISDRAISRLAPDGAATSQSPMSRGLASLRFADQRLAPYIQRAHRSTSPRLFDMATPLPERRVDSPLTAGGGGGGLSGGNWIFADPWFLDELDWDESVMALPGQSAAPARAPRSSAARAPLSALARTYSPTVPFAAAQAAQLMLSSRAQASGATRGTSAADFSYVAPQQIAEVFSGGAPLELPPVTAVDEAATSADRELQAAPLPITISPQRALPAAGPRIATPVGLSGLVTTHAVKRVARQPMRAIARAVSPQFLAPRVPAPALATSSPSLDSSPGAANQVTPRPVFAESMDVTAPRESGFADSGEVATSAQASTPVATATALVPAPARTLATSGYQAIAPRPAAIKHVGWADRWLARFAGASPAALSTFEASPGLSRPARLAPAAASVGAPEMVSLSSPTPVRVEPTPASPAPVLSAATEHRPPSGAPIVEEGESVSDEAFAAIAAGLASERGRPAASSPRPAASAVNPPAPETVQAVEPAMSAATDVGLVANAAPVAAQAPLFRSAIDRRIAAVEPSFGPGVAPGLASSPAATALRGVIGVSPAPGFDVRSLASPVAWLTPVATSPLETATTETGAPALRSPAVLEQPVLQRPAFEQPVVAGSARPDRRGSGTLGATRARQRDLFMRAQPQFLSAKARGSAAPVTPRTPASATPSFVDAGIAQVETSAERQVDSPPISYALPTQTPIREAGPTTTAGLALSPARTELPDLLPGAVGRRAASFSVSQSLAAQDLALDFVSPETMVAARVYGFAPSQVVAAGRLSAAGHDGIFEVARALDHAMLDAAGPARPAMNAEQALAARASRGDTGPSSLRPIPRMDLHAPLGPQTPQSRSSRPAARPASGAAAGLPAAHWRAALASPQTLSARPKGPVLMSDTVAQAFRITPTSAPTTTRAALDLMAAAYVYAAGTEVSPSSSSRPHGADLPPTSSTATSEAGIVADLLSADEPADGPRAAPSPQQVEAKQAQAAVEAQVGARPWLALPMPVVPPVGGSREQVSPRSAVVRAAQAMAAVHAAGEGVTAKEHASVAWSMAPIWLDAGPTPEVRGTDEPTRGARSQSAAASAWAAPTPGARVSSSGTANRNAPALTQLSPASGSSMPTTSGNASRPSGQASTSTRRPAAVAAAGQSLSSIVTPAQARNEERPPAPAPVSLAAPTAAQPLVSSAPSPGASVNSNAPTSGARKAGDPKWATDFQVPDWFEDAARKLLGDSGGDGRGLSLAEMTLVSAAPAKHVSPDLRQASAPAVDSKSGGAGTGTQYDAPAAPDIEELAQEVYETVMRMIELARERSGDPWQQT